MGENMKNRIGAIIVCLCCCIPPIVAFLISIITEMELISTLLTIGFFVILLEKYFDFPFGTIKLPFVFCFIPPFIKRFRIFGYWIGFDNNWKFIWLKKEHKNE